MTTLTKKKLLDDLKDKETRELFAEEHIATGIPFQTRALREKMGLTQAELSRKAKMAQERISLLEDPDYQFLPKINTLLKLANAFDVPLIVRFGTWSELFDREVNLSPEHLAPRTFDEEVACLESTIINTHIPASHTNFVISAEYLKSVVTEAVQSVVVDAVGSISPADSALNGFVEKRQISADFESRTIG